MTRKNKGICNSTTQNFSPSAFRRIFEQVHKCTNFGWNIRGDHLICGSVDFRTHKERCEVIRMRHGKNIFSHEVHESLLVVNHAHEGIMAEIETSAYKSGGSPQEAVTLSAQEATTFAIIVSIQTFICPCEAESRQHSTASLFSLIPSWSPIWKNKWASLRRMTSIIRTSWSTLTSKASSGPTWTRT